MQNLTTGAFVSTTQNLSSLTNASNAAHTIRARYLAMVGDPKVAGVTTKFTVLQKGTALFTSGSVLKAGDTTVGGIKFTDMSNSGKYIVIIFDDATDGFNHVQVWVGS